MKASQLGEYIPARLGFDENERAIALVVIDEYRDSDNIVFIFENGKGVRVPAVSYQTKTNRKKLTAAFSDASPAVAILHETEPFDIIFANDQKKFGHFDE